MSNVATSSILDSLHRRKSALRVDEARQSSHVDTLRQQLEAASALQSDLRQAYLGADAAIDALAGYPGWNPADQKRLDRLSATYGLPLAAYPLDTGGEYRCEIRFEASGTSPEKTIGGGFDFPSALSAAEKRFAAELLLGRLVVVHCSSDEEARTKSIGSGRWCLTSQPPIEGSQIGPIYRLNVDLCGELVSTVLGAKETARHACMNLSSYYHWDQPLEAGIMLGSFAAMIDQRLKAHKVSGRIVPVERFLSGESRGRVAQVWTLKLEIEPSGELVENGTACRFDEQLVKEIRKLYGFTLAELETRLRAELKTSNDSEGEE